MKMINFNAHYQQIAQLEKKLRATSNPDVRKRLKSKIRKLYQERNQAITYLQQARERERESVR